MKPLELVKSDLYRHTGKVTNLLIIKNLLNNNRSFKYTFWLRLSKSDNLLIRTVSKFMHRHLSIKYQIQIPASTKIGPGLYLGHSSSVMINSTAVIGRNCNLSQFTTIGSNHGQAAIIGDNVYIGPNCCIVESIKLGDNTTIGAGSVVIRDVPDNSTAVGNPARSFPSKSAGCYINNSV